MDYRPSLFEAMQTAIADHEKQCPGPGLIYIGKLSQFKNDLFEDGNLECHHPVWLHGDDVLLTIGCPGSPHDKATASLTTTVCAELMRKASEGIGDGALEAYSSVTIPGLRNNLGCTLRLLKEADACVCWEDPTTKDKQAFPCLVAEVAMLHESPHVFFCEAASWLNGATSTNYVILLLFVPRSRQFHVNLLRRNEPAAKRIEAKNLSQVVPPLC
jgi:hypothetical protein